VSGSTRQVQPIMRCTALLVFSGALRYAEWSAEMLDRPHRQGSLLSRRSA
jgi:hypothetical protein